MGTDVYASVDTRPITGRVPAGRSMIDYFSDDPPIIKYQSFDDPPIPGRCPAGDCWFQIISNDVRPSIGRSPETPACHWPMARLFTLCFCSAYSLISIYIFNFLKE